MYVKQVQIIELHCSCATQFVQAYQSVEASWGLCVYKLFLSICLCLSWPHWTSSTCKHKETRIKQENVTFYCFLYKILNIQKKKHAMQSYGGIKDQTPKENGQQLSVFHCWREKRVSFFSMVGNVWKILLFTLLGWRKKHWASCVVMDFFCCYWLIQSWNDKWVLTTSRAQS